MVPPAPARFSTITCWPSASENAGARVRAVMSTLPLGGHGTTMRSGRLGKSGQPGQGKRPGEKDGRNPHQHGEAPLPAGRMKGYIDRMSKAKVTDLKKHYPDLAPDKDYPPLKFKSLKGRGSAAEWEARVDCACAYRLVRHYDMHDLIYNHISARIPGTEEFLLNPFGLLYEEMCASSLIKVDLEGKVLWEPDWPQGLNYTFNLAGFVIHGAIHAAKPGIHCVIHTHSLAGMAVASLKKGVLPMTQTALRFSRITYHDYEREA